MPPNDTSDPSQRSAARHKSSASRTVVPAIPLALSKPKSGKSKAKADEDGGVVQTSVARHKSTSDQPADNAINGVVYTPATSHATSSSHGAVQMPSNYAPRSRGRVPSFTDGGTSDVIEPDEPSTPPATNGASIATSPGSSRNPTDRSDMRQIRTELPPAFVPSAEQHTPRSTGSSSSNRPVFYSHAHPTHPSASNIQFGGETSMGSSPAPPTSADSVYPPPQLPTHGAPSQRTFPPQSHIHHSSEPQGQRMFQPGYQPPNTPWNVRQAYGQPMQPPYMNTRNPTSFRYPPPEVFTPGDPNYTNGHSSRSRSESQASFAPAPDQSKIGQPLQSPISPEGLMQNNGRPAFYEGRPGFPRHAHPHPLPFNPQTGPPPSFPPPDLNASLENAEALQHHVQSLFSNSTFSDCQLQITEISEGAQRQTDGHRIILGRSPTLADLMQNTPRSSDKSSPSEIRVELEGPYLRLDAFTKALNYLYGGQLLQLDHHRPGSSAGEHIPSNSERMDHALQYVAAGSWLKVPPIASRGIEVAGGLLHWDTLTAALSFALHGGISPIWTVDDGSEDPASSSSSDDSLGRPENTSMPTYDPSSTHLLQRIIDFTVHMFPVNFYLDASAPQITSCPRLPSLPPGHESRPSRSDPRLSQIRFGEAPSEDHQRPSFATSIISSVLLSLPFSLLKCVLEHYDLVGRLGLETVASIMRQVVAERERRRTKILGARGAARPFNESTDSGNAQLVKNLFWQESVEESAHHRAGFRLARRKRDIDTPPSSGACSERNK